MVRRPYVVRDGEAESRILVVLWVYVVIDLDGKKIGSDWHVEICFFGSMNNDELKRFVPTEERVVEAAQ